MVKFRPLYANNILTPKELSQMLDIIAYQGHIGRHVIVNSGHLTTLICK